MTQSADMLEPAFDGAPEYVRQIHAQFRTWAIARGMTPTSERGIKAIKYYPDDRYQAAFLATQGGREPELALRPVPMLNREVLREAFDEIGESIEIWTPDNQPSPRLSWTVVRKQLEDYLDRHIPVSNRSLRGGIQR